MKRLIGALALTAVLGSAFAQAPFTVVSPRNYNPDTNRPLSREKIVIKFPKNSIPSNGYVGIYLGATRGDKIENEKFIEATTLPLQGSYYTYTLDTKSRQIADGMYTLRAVLYVDYSDRPRELSQTQVNIRVANHSSIKIPAGGLKLRYNFQPGTEMAYRLEVRTAVSTISAAQNSLGGRAAELPLESETLRMLYAVDQSFGNGDSLVRMQPLPLRGKDYVWVTTTGSDTPAKYYTYEMAPIYMRMTNTGREVYGAIPPAISSSAFVPINTTSSRVDLYADFPLPTLPSKAVKPGDSWQSSYPEGVIDLANRGTMNKVSRPITARGELVDLEYEMGHPCAKIHNTVTAGMRTTEGAALTKQGREFSDEKVSLDETVYFALDTRRVIKVIRDITRDTKQQAAGSGFGSGGDGGSNGSAPASPTGPSRGGGGGRRGAAGGGDWNLPGSINQRRPGPMGTAGANSGSGDNGGFQGGRGNNAPSGAAQYFRYRSQMIFILEK